jgi:hypothetical protein
MMFSSAPPTPQVFWHKINWGIFPIKLIIYTTKKLIPKVLGNSWGNVFCPKNHKWWDNVLNSYYPIKQKLSQLKIVN